MSALSMDMDIGKIRVNPLPYILAIEAEAATLDRAALAAALMATGHIGDDHTVSPLLPDHMASHPDGKCDFLDEAEGYADAIIAALAEARRAER